MTSIIIRGIRGADVTASPGLGADPSSLTPLKTPAAGKNMQFHGASRTINVCALVWPW